MEHLAGAGRARRRGAARAGRRRADRGVPAGDADGEAAADAVGCEPAQIVKSLVFICDGLPVLALVPGDRRADAAKVAAAAGAGYARVAKREEVLAATGFEPGGVAPFPVPPSRAS